MTMISLYYLRHNLTLNALTDLTHLVNTILGVKVLPETKYLYKKFFPKYIKPQSHYYCPKCQNGIEDITNKVCEICECPIDCAKLKSTNFFLTMPINYQIKDVMRRCEGNVDFRSPKNNEICDVHDGLIYKNLLRCQSQTKLLTLIMNTDGVKIQASKKHGSFYPIQLIINEIHASVRYKPDNIIICGLWYGGEPNFELFFKPLVLEIEKLNKKGFQIQFSDKLLEFFIAPIICAADTPAQRCCPS